ncbi:hypothetical protein RRSWK_06382 [Rhodopirellula sp. SWK7]|nr:hypothetical protein RRSWK_06382 [Rhodopirellula sp. SWK7]
MDERNRHEVGERLMIVAGAIGFDRITTSNRSAWRSVAANEGRESGHQWAR